MKQFLLLFLCSLFIAGGCRKDDTMNQLPPETQKGADTFGCLINGQVFIPGGKWIIGGHLQCTYQFFNGKYSFMIDGTYRSKKDGSISSVGLIADSIRIHQGDKLQLKTRASGNTSANYFRGIGGSQYEEYETDGSSYTGELWIKKYDSIYRIISGTFFYDGVDANGHTVEIREGRFDVHYPG